MSQRAISLDALRGIAVLGMVLSGSIAFNGVLPAWMYHAQVPPPLHKFDPSIAGITWVDLVFPFFLFAMGAAIPLALKAKLAAGAGYKFFVPLAIKRFLLLAFFALFTQHMKAWVLAETPGVNEYLLSILAFILLFFQFYRAPFKSKNLSQTFFVIKLLAFAIAVLLLALLPFKDGAGFNFFKSDIILLVLANIVLAGILIYGFTYNRPVLRLALLPIILAIFLAGKEPADSWTKTILNFSHIGSFDISWLYKFYFLKYLIIVIPAMYAGEWLLKIGVLSTIEEPKKKTNKTSLLIAALVIVIVLINLFGLYNRLLFVNFITTSVCCFLLLKLNRQLPLQFSDFYKLFLQAGTYLLLLGLFFEAYEGGIKKDSSTYSYYFVCSGLAFLLIFGFQCFLQSAISKPVINWLAAIGQNPMVAYVAGSLLVTPILYLSGLQVWMDQLNSNAFTGFLKGVIFTGLVSLITILFNRRKWYWRT